MFLGMGMRDRDLTCETCWTQLEKGFKFIFLSCLLVCALGFVPIMNAVP